MPDPSDAEDFAWRGQAYQAIGRYQEARFDYSRVVELDPAMSNTVSTYLAQLPDDDQPAPDSVGKDKDGH